MVYVELVRASQGSCHWHLAMLAEVEERLLLGFQPAVAVSAAAHWKHRGADDLPGTPARAIHRGLTHGHYIFMYYLCDL